MEKNSLMKRDLRNYLLAVTVLLLINLLGGLLFTRIDLTAEKRFTLAPVTRTTLRNLDDVVLVRVYLDGELPPEFVRFRTAIRELLDEFRAYAGDRLQYEFINLYEEKDTELRNKIIGELYDKGLQVTNIQARDEDGSSSSRIIFPGAMISCRGAEMPVNLLKNNPALAPEQNLNNSMETLEFEFIRSIKSLTLKEIPRIAFIEGHGELDSTSTHSIMDELKNFFQVDRGHINGNLNALLAYKALVFAQPIHPFSERDKFAIDQYIMRGGRVLFFLDPVLVQPDSLAGGMTLGLVNQLNIEDLLFKYGVRFDYSLVTDLQCNYVPVNMAVAGEQPRFVMKPWIYFPLLAGDGINPVTRGLNYVKTAFVSPVDTVPDNPAGVKKTVLLTTSGASLRLSAPLRIDVDEVNHQPDPAMFSQGPVPVAVMLEGSFESFYKNYGVPAGVTPASAEIIPKSSPARVFVCGDGDIIRNEISTVRGRPVAEPLGYDKYTRQTFGNREFIMNVINYMTDDSGLMSLRAREFRLRLLDREKITDSRVVLKWKLINSILPVLLVVVAGLIFNYFRKKRYAV
ncbi:MAG: gliding motility-associated ABC transporter substrate-binding protein GldG [Bacteroidota bacterium]